MGVVIDYRGTLDEMALMDRLIADVRLFCQQAGWEFAEVSDHISGIAMGSAADFTGPRKRQSRREAKESDPKNWPEEETFRMGGLTLRFDAKNPMLLEETCRGIIAQPPGTDSLALTFDGQGRLCHFMAISQHWVKGPLKDQKHYLCFPLFCKTTGETEQHIAICVLLRMLRDRYIKDLKVGDETGYFRSGKLGKLRRAHALMTGFISAIKGNPEFLKGVLKAAGIDEKLVEGAVLLPDTIRLPVGGSGRKAKKPTVH